MIAETGFVPNQRARGLSKRRSSILGLLIPYPSDQLFAGPHLLEIMRGIEAEANLRDYGGISASDAACQIQANLLGLPVIRAADTETSVRAAALPAGLGAAVCPAKPNCRHWPALKLSLSRATTPQRARPAGPPGSAPSIGHADGRSDRNKACPEQM